MIQEDNVTLQTEAATVNIAEAARLLGIGRQTAYLLARQGKLPALRLGKRLVVPKVALEQMLADAGKTSEAE